MTAAGDTPSKKADLWEPTIASAVRDLQWILRVNKDLAPEASLAMKGLAETALGDSFVSSGEHLFLFELKATAKGKEREWGVGSEKLAYLSLSRAISAYPFLVDDEKERIELLRMLWLSIRAHHFAYWIDAPGSSGEEREGGLTFSSYLLDALPHLDSPCPLTKRFIKNLQQGRSLAAFDHTAGARMARLAPELSLDRAFKGEGYAVTLAKAGDEIVVAKMDPVGLKVAEMQRYVDWLVEFQAGQDLPVNAILCSRSGNYFRKVGSIRSVAKLLSEISELPCQSLAELSSIKRYENFSSEHRLQPSPSQTSRRALVPGGKKQSE